MSLINAYLPSNPNSALERERTITSIPLAEERQILKEINSVKKSQLQIAEYDAIEKQIEEKRVSVKGGTNRFAFCLLKLTVSLIFLDHNC